MTKEYFFNAGVMSKFWKAHPQNAYVCIPHPKCHMKNLITTGLLMRRIFIEHSPRNNLVFCWICINFGKIDTILNLNSFSVCLFDFPTLVNLQQLFASQTPSSLTARIQMRCELYFFIHVWWIFLGCSWDKSVNVGDLVWEKRIQKMGGVQVCNEARKISWLTSKLGHL